MILYHDDAPRLPPAAEDLLARVVEATLAAEELADAQVDLLLTGDEPIRTLNREHRGKDAVTDVLSFPLWHPEEIARWRAGYVPPGQPPDEPLRLGDVVINVAEARRAAERYGHSLERELGFLAVHGILHLAGYDHDTPEEEARMQARVEAVLAGLGLTRDAPPAPGGPA